MALARLLPPAQIGSSDALKVRALLRWCWRAAHVLGCACARARVGGGGRGRGIVGFVRRFAHGFVECVPEASSARAGARMVDEGWLPLVRVRSVASDAAHHDLLCAGVLDAPSLLEILHVRYQKAQLCTAIGASLVNLDGGAWASLTPGSDDFAALARAYGRHGARPAALPPHPFVLATTAAQGGRFGMRAHAVVFCADRGGRLGQVLRYITKLLEPAADADADADADAEANVQNLIVGVPVTHATHGRGMVVRAGGDAQPWIIRFERGEERAYSADECAMRLRVRALAPEQRRSDRLHGAPAGAAAGASSVQPRARGGGGMPLGRGFEVRGSALHGTRLVGSLGAWDSRRSGGECRTFYGACDAVCLVGSCTRGAHVVRGGNAWWLRHPPAEHPARAHACAHYQCGRSPSSSCRR